MSTCMYDVNENYRGFLLMTEKQDTCKYLFQHTSVCERPMTEKKRGHYTKSTL